MDIRSDFESAVVEIRSDWICGYSDYTSVFYYVIRVSKLNLLGSLLDGIPVFADMCNVSELDLMRMPLSGKSGYNGITNTLYE